MTWVPRESKFAVVDVFDGNTYAKDTRKDFMNWSLWAPGAFDYSADKVGLTYGVTAELNQKQWALRGGYFLMVAESNSNHFDTRVGERGQYVLELETRFSLLGQPGKLRTLPVPHLRERVGPRSRGVGVAGEDPAERVAQPLRGEAGA